jgi:hypothetical protein
MTVRRLLSALLVALTGLALAVVASDPATAASTPTLRLRDPGMPCAGQTSWIAGNGFVPGKAYNFSTVNGRMTSTPITAGPDGTLELALPIPRYVQIAGYVRLEAEAADNPYVELAFLELEDFGPVASIDPTTNSPVALAYFPVNSQLHLAVNCFQSGEDVQLSSPQLTLGPASVSYRPDGTADISAKVLAVNASGMAAVTIIGATSGSQAVAKVSTGGNVLMPGIQLEDPGSGQLVSPSGNYRMIIQPGGFYVCHLPATKPNMPCDRTWTLPSSPPLQPEVTALQMQSNGNLAIVKGSEQGWSTGTAGTGNRLTMRDDGVLALTSPQGDLQWSNKVGTIRGPAGYLSIPYIAGSRVGRAVYVNGLIKHWNAAGQLVRCARCQVYLQRFLNGSWQYVVARTTDSAGQIAVGFIQTTVYRYRWKVAYAPDLTGSISTGIDR